jgi:XTP/dITP diphosphohydrolase
VIVGAARMRLVLATENPHKRRELAALLPTHELLPLPAGVVLGPEVGATFAENALAKARTVALATGACAIADDSGIEAQALAGAPGVFSARYAGPHATDEENLALLVAQAPAGSALTYVCVIAFVDPVGGVEQLFDGRCSGRLAAHPRGDGGFGYDPAFVPDDVPGDVTMAELTAERKDAISHRGRAARALARWLHGDERYQRGD